MHLAIFLAKHPSPLFFLSPSFYPQNQTTLRLWHQSRHGPKTFHIPRLFFNEDITWDSFKVGKQNQPQVKDWFFLQVKCYKLSPTMISLSSWWNGCKKRKGSRHRSGRNGRKPISTCKCRSASGLETAVWALHAAGLCCPLWAFWAYGQSAGLTVNSEASGWGLLRFECTQGNVSRVVSLALCAFR